MTTIVRTPAFAARTSRGLTLIELLVVMAIIAALAGLIVPFLPDMTDRATSATNASNIKDLGRAVQTYRTVRGSEPGRWDSLLEGADGDTLFHALPAGASGPAGGAIVPLDLAGDTDALAALANAGISHAYGMDDGTGDDFDATFNPLDGGTIHGFSFPGTSAFVAQVDGSVDNPSPLLKFGHSIGAGEIFVAFGVGTGCGLVGKDGGLTEAPVAYQTGVDVSEVYARYVVIYQLNDDNGYFEKARFICVAAIGEDALLNADDFASDYSADFN